MFWIRRFLRAMVWQGPQVGDNDGDKSGNDVPFVFGQPTVCKQPEPSSETVG